MGRWAAIKRKKESQLSEECRIEKRMGPLDGQAIKHGNIEQPSYNYNGWIGEQATHWVRSGHQDMDGNRITERMADRATEGAAGLKQQLNTGTLQNSGRENTWMISESQN